jgi:hypothetical protein
MKVTIPLLQRMKKKKRDSLAGKLTWERKAFWAHVLEMSHFLIG